MKQKSLLTCLCLVLILFMGIPKVFAHVLKTDGSIGVVFHTDPDDNPIAGQQAGLFFSFKDTQNKFTPQQCECQLTVTESGKMLYSQPLFQNSTQPNSLEASAFFTFPKIDTYSVTITGKPYTPNAFQSFTITYPVVVANGNKAAKSTPENTDPFINPEVILSLSAAFFILILSGVFFIKKRNNQS